MIKKSPQKAPNGTGATSSLDKGKASSHIIVRDAFPLSKVNIADCIELEKDIIVQDAFYNIKTA